MTSSKLRRILCVDDDPDLRKIVTMSLQDVGDLAAHLASFVRNKSGAVAAEYAILLAAVAVVVAVAMAVLDDSLTGVLRDAADCVEVGCV